MKKKYEITKYEGVEKVKRFVLGNEGNHPLFVIGLNPSKADKNEPDLTITRIMGYVDKSKRQFDSFIMLNLYAQCSTNPNELHVSTDEELHAQNIKHIIEILSKHEKPSILAAWGGTIKVRDYLFTCLKSIRLNTAELQIEWLKIGKLTENDKGHPRHPSRGFYSDLTPFDIDGYIESFKEKSKPSSLR